MSEYKKYPEYKDSGIDWLGDIPSNWDVIKLANIATSEPNSFTDGDWIESEYITDSGVRLLQTGNIGVGKYKEQGGRFISDETFHKLNCSEINPGDLLICRLADPVGRSAIAPDLGVKMITSVDVCILKTNDNYSSEFYNYVFSDPVYLEWIKSTVRGSTRARVRRSTLSRFRLQAPPLPTQNQIVSFLDIETKKIDDSVASMESLISLLTEKRSALISETVTRGIPGDHAEFKDSGVEWLGAIPASWGIGKIKRSISSLNGGSWGEEKGVLETTIRCLRVADFDRHTSSIHSKNPTDRSYPTLEVMKKAAHAGDLILEKSGGGEKTPVGNVVIYDGKDPIMYSNFVTRLVIRKNQDSYYWCYVHKSLYEKGLNVKSIKQNTGIQNLDIDEYLNEKVAFPSIAEQKRIVKFLNTETQKIDTIINEAKKSISLLKDKRQTLISDAVTGKIDVRDIVN